MYIFGSMKGYQDRLPRRRISVQLHAEIKKAGLVLSALRHQPSHDGGFPLLLHPLRLEQFKFIPSELGADSIQKDIIEITVSGSSKKMD